jgi:signal transduction histidine kinase
VFKTIFSKLIVLFISIIIISFSVTGVMLFYFLDSFVYSQKESLLKLNAQAVNNAFTNMYVPMVKANNPWAEIYFKGVLDNCQSQTDSWVWIVDPTGKINFYSPENVVLPRKLIDESRTLRLPDKRQYNKVMLSGADVVKEKGDFYGLFEGESYLIIQKQLKYKDAAGNDQIAGALYLSLAMPQVRSLQWDIYSLFLMSMSVSVLIAGILAYLFSVRISRPLKEINNAAKVIANGEFEKRLNINSKDEIGELANSFNNMVVALQNLEEMRRGFIANVSHELRTPMTSIRGFIEGILDGTIPQERQNNYLAIVRDEANRMNRMVNDLLDLARMEAGEVKLNMVEFNINELMRRSIIKVETLIMQKNLSIEAVFEREEMFVHADMDSIERVILNLLHNAVKFTPQDGKITLRTSYHRGKVIVSIEDSGIGISKDEINRIWDRFYKSDKSRGQDKTGTGLGLAIVKNIISEHEQEIWVESELGAGTKFTFTLKRSEGKPI